ncbi:MAG TPA: hypothetical protein ENN03_10835 [bacterium]|nr:hypothetical protein [bacterium]
MDTIRCSRFLIDCVDRTMVRLLYLRMRLVRHVGRIKQARGLPVHDNIRETSVLNRIRCRIRPPLEAGQVKAVFEEIFRISRELQKTLCVQPEEETDDCGHET